MVECIIGLSGVRAGRRGRIPPCVVALLRLVKWLEIPFTKKATGGIRFVVLTERVGFTFLGLQGAALLFVQGVSPSAEGDQRLCLWTLPPLKRRAKLFVRDLKFRNGVCARYRGFFMREKIGRECKK